MGRRGRLPKKPDAVMKAAVAAISPDNDPTNPELAQPHVGARQRSKAPDSAPSAAKKTTGRRVFRPVPGAGTEKPLDMAVVRAMIAPRPGTTRREWPIASVGPKTPPRPTPEELKQITDIYIEKYGPIMSLIEAANVAKLSKQTLRRYVCEGCFADSVYRGRPLRFLTQRFIAEVLR